MIGNFARSLAGHDKGQLYIIIEETAECFILADGKQKTFENPKKKNKKHVQIIKKECNEELKTRLQNQEAVNNEAVKRAIKLYELEVNECQKPM